jgi:hypothetical protein
LKDKPSTSYVKADKDKQRLSVSNSKVQKIIFSETATQKIDGINAIDFQNKNAGVDLEQSLSAEE